MYSGEGDVRAVAPEVSRPRLDAAPQRPVIGPLLGSVVRWAEFGYAGFFLSLCGFNWLAWVVPSLLKIAFLLTGVGPLGPLPPGTVAGKWRLSLVRLTARPVVLMRAKRLMALRVMIPR